MREPPVIFRPLAEVPPRSNLAPLEGVIEVNGPKTVLECFRDFADGWGVTVFCSPDGVMLVNQGHWDLGRRILDGDRAVAAERDAEATRKDFGP
jgi:hypothetical protein